MFGSRRWFWITLAIIFLGVGSYYVERRNVPTRSADTVEEVTKAMAKRYVEVDREFAARMEAHRSEMPPVPFGPEQAIVATKRTAMRAWVAGATGIIDESLAKRERIGHEFIAQIEASKAGENAKRAMLAGIRTAAVQVPLSVKLMNATRAYLEKTGEMVAYLDQNALAIALREGQLEFDDPAAGERYNQFEHELAALEQELQRLQKQAQR